MWLFGQDLFIHQGYFDGYLEVGLGHIFFEEDPSVQQPQPALDVLEPEPGGAFIEFFEVGLGEALAIVVDTNEEFVPTRILGKVDEAGIAVFEHVVYQFLDDPEQDQFVLRFHTGPVVMKPTAGIHTAGAADLLEKVIHRTFQPKILEGGGHEAVRDVPDQLNGIVDDLFGVIDALELGRFVEVNQVFVQVQAGSCQQGTGIVMEVGGNPLAFLFLQADGGIQQHLLLVLF